MPRSSTLLGSVQDVAGSTVSVALDRATASGLTFVNGRGYRIGQIGSFVRVSIGFADLYGIVAQVGAGAVPQSAVESQPHGFRWMRVQLVGEGSSGSEFSRGISQYPTIGDEVHLVTETDLSKIYGVAGANHFVRVGSIASAESIEALLNVDRLITRHSAVVGTTGSGKSTTVAGLLAALSDPSKFPSARIIILDMHGEYHAALRDRATVFRTNPDAAKGEQQLCVPYWAMNADELLAATPLGTANEADRATVFERIRELKKSSLVARPRAGVSPETLTVDSPVPFSIHRLWYELYRFVLSTHTAQAANQDATTEAIESNDRGEPILGDMLQTVPPTYRPITSSGAGRVYLSGAPLNIRRQLVAMQSLLRDGRFDFLFRPGPWCPEASLTDLDAQPEADLDVLIESWLGGTRPISILDLSGVPTSVVTPLVGVVLRLVMDALFWGRAGEAGGRARPVLVVLEEAHGYLGATGGGQAAASARRIVKEGRKYGVGAMIVSQRPSEIDPTVLSQCGTIIALRLANQQDRAQVASAASDQVGGLLDMLPTLRTGEAIVVGEAVQLPLRVLVDRPSIDRRPDSDDPLVFDPNQRRGWNATRKAEDYAQMVTRWRRERS